MPVKENVAAVCPDCGTRMETTTSGDLGCMVCWLRVGLDGADASEDKDAAFAPLPDQFGPYTIAHRDDGSLWELGRGAMGVTFRAIDTSLARPVALKIIQAELGGRGAEARERFMREARSAGALRHPNIATVYHFGIREETGQCFYAMELVEGETLEMRVRRSGPLDALASIDIALQISSALAAAERQGLVHRDLKPANLMLISTETDSTERGRTNISGERTRLACWRWRSAIADFFQGSDPAGRKRKVRRGESPQPARESRALPGPQRAANAIVKVIDFGVAKALLEKTDTMVLTHGGFIGTPAFASPEQFTNAPVDVRSDIYSLGATLWYLLTGHRPFPGATIEQIRASHQSHALPIEHLQAARVPRRLVSLVVSMLAFEPAARPGVRTLTSRLQDCRAHILDRWKATRRFTLAATLSGFAIATLLSFPQRHNRISSENAAPANISEKSIAVLPFTNMSGATENDFFTDAVHDQVLTYLAMVADLKVISRTSVMEYKNGATRNLREIARQLGVAHVLEGRVQRAGGNVRVTAQLINASSVEREWAENYDRPVGEVFAIQSEIATTIADQLQARISPSEKAAMAVAPTIDLVANALYQQAQSLQEKLPYDQAGLESVRLLNQAIARDSQFVRAYYLLGEVHLVLYFGGYDHTSARRELAKVAIENAARLQPEGGEVHLAWARYHYHCSSDYDSARTELELARRTLPNDAEAYFLSGILDRVQGRWTEAIRNAERAVELDPRNRRHVLLAAGAYSQLRRYSEAQPFLDRALELPPNDYFNQVLHMELPFDARADIRPMRKELSAILAKDADAEKKIANELFLCALLERDSLGAARAVAALPAERLYPREWFAGLADRTFNNPVAARTSFSAARPTVERIVLAQPDYAQAWSLLGRIDAALGRREEAVREGRHACELLPLSKNATRGADLIRDLAVIYAWVGEKELALEQLEISAQIPAGVSYGELKLEPQWDSLRSDPRFDKIVALLAPK